MTNNNLSGQQIRCPPLVSLTVLPTRKYDSNSSLPPRQKPLLRAHAQQTPTLPRRNKPEIRKTPTNPLVQLRSSKKNQQNPPTHAIPGVDGDGLLDDEPILDQLAHGETRGGLLDLGGLVRIEPDLVDTALLDRGGQTLLVGRHGWVFG